MVAELISGLSIFKGMLDTAKGLKDISDASVRAGVAIELQNKIDAQAQQTVLLEKLGGLERKIAGFDRWELDSARYALQDFGSGTFAYLLRPDRANGEPPHRLCSTCFEVRRKSILQFLHENFLGQKVYNCPVCKTELALGTPRNPPESPHRGGGDWMS